MNRSERDDLLNKALRKRLSEAERQQWDDLLKEDAGLRENFGEELALERALEALPDVPISSNFTSLVVQAAIRKTAQPRAASWRMRWPLLRFAPAAIVFVMLCSAGLFGYHNYSVRREEMALNVRSFSEVASMVSASKTSPEDVFQNFEAIQRLSLPADSDLDMELLVALQK